MSNYHDKQYIEARPEVTEVDTSLSSNKDFLMVQSYFVYCINKPNQISVKQDQFVLNLIFSKFFHQGCGTIQIISLHSYFAYIMVSLQKGSSILIIQFQYI